MEGIVKNCLETNAPHYRGCPVIRMWGVAYVEIRQASARNIINNGKFCGWFKLLLFFQFLFFLFAVLKFGVSFLLYTGPNWKDRS